jgi:hypothetical protein
VTGSCEKIKYQHGQECPCHTESIEFIANRGTGILAGVVLKANFSQFPVPGFPAHHQHRPQQPVPLSASILMLVSKFAAGY